MADDAVVTVRFFAAAREAAHASVEEVPATTAAELVAALHARHGERMGQVLAVSTLLVAGQRAAPDTALPPGAVVDVLPPFAGG